jgi:hypothetical protein
MEVTSCELTFIKLFLNQFEPAVVLVAEAAELE